MTSCCGKFRYSFIQAKTVSLAEEHDYYLTHVFIKTSIFHAITTALQTAQNSIKPLQIIHILNITYISATNYGTILARYITAI